jgi:cell division protein FtsI/penicillin-binding protein 2
LNILDKSNIVYIDPTEIDQSRIKEYAKRIHKVFSDKKRASIELYLTKRKVQYVPLKRKVSPEVSDKIKKLKSESYLASKKS